MNNYPDVDIDFEEVNAMHEEEEDRDAYYDDDDDDWDDDEQDEDEEIVDHAHFFKVGQQVRVRAENTSNVVSLYGAGRENVGISGEMQRFNGKIVTIIHQRSRNRYVLEEDNGRYIWHEACFELFITSPQEAFEMLVREMISVEAYEEYMKGV